MKRLIAIFALSFVCSTAHAGYNQNPATINRGLIFTAPAVPLSGWTSLGQLGSSFTKTSNDPWNWPTTNTLEVGNVVVCGGAVDNDGNGTDTDDWNVGGDSAGNTYTHIGENEADPGAASAGGAVMSKYSLATIQLAAAGTLSYNFPAARNSKAGNCWEFDITGTAVAVAGTEQKEDVAAGDAGSLTVSGLSAGEHICIRWVSSETGTTETITKTTGWETFGDVGTTGSTDNTNMRLWGEYLIFTGTSATSNPTFSGSFDRGSTMICLDQS